MFMRHHHCECCQQQLGWIKASGRRERWGEYKEREKCEVAAAVKGWRRRLGQRGSCQG